MFPSLPETNRPPVPASNLPASPRQHVNINALPPKTPDGPALHNVLQSFAHAFLQQQAAAETPADGAETQRQIWLRS